MMIFVSPADTGHEEPVRYRKEKKMKFLQARFMDKANLRDVGLLLLRIAMLSLVVSGVGMLSNQAGTVESMAKAPISSAAPEFFAIIIPLGQVILPILIAVGLFTRGSGLLVAIMFVGIMFLVEAQGQVANLFAVNEYGSLQIGSGLPFFVYGIVLMFTGAGRYSLDYAFGKAGDPQRGEVAVAE